MSVQFSGKIIEIGKNKDGKAKAPPTLESGHGAGEKPYFWRSNDELYCFRPSCDSCRYDKGCEREVAELKVGSGVNIRRAFRARPGFQLAAIDYRGIELRVAAQLSQEPVWLEAFQKGLDLHTMMAKVAFKTSEPTKSERDMAKCANFGNLFLGCLSGDTRVQTRDGYRPIREILGVREIWTGYSWERASVFATGVKETKRLRLSDNSELRATEDHVFFILQDGEIAERKLRDLNPGDLLFLPPEGVQAEYRDFVPWDWRSEPKIRQFAATKGFSITELPPDFHWMLGLLVGDGWLVGNGRRVGFLIVEEDIAQKERLERVLLALGLDFRSRSLLGKPPRTQRLWHIEVQNVAFSFYLREVLGMTAEKLFPETSFSASPANVAQLIEGFYYADSRKSKTAPISQNNAAGEKRIRQLQLLLRRLGVVGRYYAYPYDYRGKHYDIHSCYVTNRGKLLRHVSLPGCEAGFDHANELYVDLGTLQDLNTLRRYSSTWTEMSHRERCTTGIYEVTRTTRKYSQGFHRVQEAYRTLGVEKSWGGFENVLRVEGIDSGDLEETYDISVLTGPNRSYTANGILVHNSWQTLQRQSSLKADEAKYVWEAWWAALPDYKKWTDRQLVIAKRDKCVRTAFGRVRDLSDLIRLAEQGGKGAKGGWGFVHRSSVNSPVQGTAADLMKMAMVRVHDWVEREGLRDDVHLMLTVHDELVSEIKDGPDFPRLCRDLAAQMTPFDLLREVTRGWWNVPLETDIEVGDNWAELVDLEKWEEQRGYGKAEIPGSVVPADSSAFSHTPTQEPPGQGSNDAVTLTLNTGFTELVYWRVKCAIFEAQNAVLRGESVGVSLKLRTSGKQFQDPAVCMGSVSYGVLKERLRGIMGAHLSEE